MKSLIVLAFLLVENSLCYSQTNTKIPYGNNPKAGHYVQADDAKLYYEVYGEGEPLIILHGGILGYMDEMTDFIDRLQKDYQVIAMATRGHGKSEIGSKPITYERRANDVLAVINAVTQDSVTVLGFSDGAYTAYKVASLFPERVKKMVAIGAGEQTPGLRTVNFNGPIFDPNNEIWTQKKKLMPEPDRLVQFWRDMEQFYNSMVADKALFMSIKCSTLVLSGELDRNAPLATVIEAYQMIPNSQLAIIPNTGHVTFMENFDAVWACIEPFLSVE
ncbi:MAG: alpha/beta hydrolase [Pseudozobellia sp.]|nr:alpha/beta hydrolase [Pseudozobellia sp.]MBG48780.1 alpha/beta hydrolase [Pseudozobellia sp.]|tara:strand:+ start:2218 stop:3042 length:825 start_codon:yes stop_codon:yes gene_type:complete